MSARTRDAIVAKHLPFMKLEIDDFTEQLREFDVEQARQLNLAGMPLLINHNDGRDGKPLYCIGTVDAAACDGLHGRVLATLDAGDVNDDAALASTRIALGIYRGVSLGHDIHTHAAAGVPLHQKSPFELSVCRRGRRPESTIDGYFPARPTLERLEPQALESFVDVYAYREAAIAHGLDASQRSEYIDFLSAESDRRLAHAVAEHGLCAQMSVQASADEVAAVDGEQQQEAAVPPAQPAAPPAEPQAPAPAQEKVAVAPAPARGVAVVADPAGEQLKSLADTALELQKSNTAYAEQLAKATVDMQAREEELARLRVEAEDGKTAKRRVEDMENAKKEALKTEFDSLMANYEVRCKKAKTPRSEFESMKTSAQTLFVENPENARTMMQHALQMAVRATEASEEVQKREKAQAEAHQTWASNFNSEYIDAQARQRAALKTRELGFQQSLSTMSSRFVTPATQTQAQQPAAPAAAAAQQPPPAAAQGDTWPEDEKAAAPAAPAAPSYAPKRGFNGTEPLPEPLSAMRAAAEKEQFGGVSEAQLFYDYAKATGKFPSMRELALGTHVHIEGSEQASADGGVGGLTREFRRLRTTPGYIGPKQLAPEWYAQLKAAYAEVCEQPRQPFARDPSILDVSGLTVLEQGDMTAVLVSSSMPSV